MKATSRPAATVAAMTIRVVFGEDSYLVREAILRVLEDEEDIDVVGGLMS